MTPGPATCTASELPRNSPVPIAPPIAIMLSWAEVSWRESCSPFSTPLVRASVVFIRSAGAARRMKDAQQPDRRGSGVLQAVQDAVGQINARIGVEFTRRHLSFQVQDSAAFENQRCFPRKRGGERELRRAESIPR